LAEKVNGFEIFIILGFLNAYDISCVGFFLNIFLNVHHLEGNSCWTNRASYKKLQLHDQQFGARSFE
jgi:hypothetical protein